MTPRESRGQDKAGNGQKAGEESKKQLRLECIPVRSESNLPKTDRYSSGVDRRLGAALERRAVMGGPQGLACTAPVVDEVAVYSRYQSQGSQS